MIWTGLELTLPAGKLTEAPVWEDRRTRGLGGRAGGRAWRVRRGHSGEPWANVCSAAGLRGACAGTMSGAQAVQTEELVDKNDTATLSVGALSGVNRIDMSTVPSEVPLGSTNVSTDLESSMSTGGPAASLRRRRTLPPLC